MVLCDKNPTIFFKETKIMIRAKVERMFNRGKSTKEIAEFFSLPIPIIENMLSHPPKKLVGGGYPGKDEKGKVKERVRVTRGYFV